MQIQVKRKNYQRSIRSYIFMTLFLLAGAGYYGYTQFTQLAMAQDAITNENTKLVELNQTAADTLNNYSLLYSDYEKDYATVKNAIDEVFPPTDKYTALATSLENYVNSLDAEDNPITMNSLQFSASDLSPSGDYSQMPFSLTLLTTRKNFENFVRYIQNSGDLKTGDQTEMVRLMEINSFNLNFVEATDELAGVLTEPLLNVNMSLTSYFQKPEPTT